MGYNRIKVGQKLDILYGWSLTSVAKPQIQIRNHSSMPTMYIVCNTAMLDYTIVQDSDDTTFTIRNMAVFTLLTNSILTILNTRGKETEDV